MGKMSRNKGAVAEKEVFKIMNDELGLELKRNLSQYQGTDSDLHLFGFCIEIKRQETLSLSTWWKQVVEVANKTKEIPVLVYRQSRQPWRAVLPITYLYNLGDEQWTLDYAYTLTMGFQPAFLSLLREVIIQHELDNLISSKH